MIKTQNRWRVGLRSARDKGFYRIAPVDGGVDLGLAEGVEKELRPEATFRYYRIVRTEGARQITRQIVSLQTTRPGGIIRKKDVSIAKRARCPMLMTVGGSETFAYADRLAARRSDDGLRRDAAATWEESGVVRRVEVARMGG